MVSENPDSGQDSSRNSNTEVEQAVAEGGAYELICKRLEDQASNLDTISRKLNDDRLQEFGDTAMGLVGRVRVRTENNCIARDIVQVNDYLLFAYNVFIGLKTQTAVNDVFELYQLNKQDETFSIEPADVTGTFLDDDGFKKDFFELYSYYKNTHLLKLRTTHNRILAFFQIGENLDDVRVFRWAIENNKIIYIDDRGEREYQAPPAYDFEWTETTRDNHVSGKHPHISILNELFIETIGGNLTIKIENNTEDGLGVYQEPVEDKTQSLADAVVHYAKLGSLILLKILPYKEKQWRYLVFNSLNNNVNRIDAIADACIQLPEDHGIIYPGGYYLQSGETKDFGHDAQGMAYERVIRSPNGEDVLYLFYRAQEGKVGLFNYNMIRKELSTPLYGHGFCLFDNGQAILFSADSDEPSRNHPMQVWETPFFSSDYAHAQPDKQTFLGNIGNAELVRAISELYSLVRSIREQTASTLRYEKLIRDCEQLFDNYYWLDEPQLIDIKSEVKDIRSTAELVIDEFEKVESIRAKANEAILKAESAQQELIKNIAHSDWKSPEDFISALDNIRHARGHLVTIKEIRYINMARIAELDSELEQQQQTLSRNTVRFLSQEKAFSEYNNKVVELQDHITTIKTVAELTPVINSLDEMSAGLDLLNEMLTTLQVDDATVRTHIIESISEVYSKLNQTKAKARNHLKTLGSTEAIAEFGAQFMLFSQSITNALGLSTTPDNCDEQLSRLLAQLEELESKFSEHDEFLADIISKREEVYESFESHKQALLDEQQRRIHNVATAAERILKGIKRRTERFTDPDEINTYFASDAMVSKCRELSNQLREIGDSVRSDDIDSQLKLAKDQSIRAQRDKQDIFESGGSVIKLGRHRFSVNTQTVDLTIVPKDDAMSLHLTGTDYFDAIVDTELLNLKSYWNQSLISESDSVYRSEFLVASILSAAEARQDELNIERLIEANKNEDDLLKLVKDFAASRYQEGYEKGIHDHDAVKILQVLLSIREQAGLLRFPPRLRALAILFWVNHTSDKTQTVQYIWHSRSQSAERLEHTYQSNDAYQKIQQELVSAMMDYFKQFKLELTAQDCVLAAEYLSHELTEQKLVFNVSQYGMELAEGLEKQLKKIKHLIQYQKTLDDLKGALDKQWALVESWLEGYSNFNNSDVVSRFIPEAIAIILVKDSVTLKVQKVELQKTISGLMGEHNLITQQSMVVALDEFTNRLHFHQNHIVPEYHQFLTLRQNIVDRERNNLRLDDFVARPLSSFVRNKLINDVYLPLIGDNLAKQMGTLGENKRTDLMGLLLLISPPGYGKTTLMEYVANRMGLIFMKINCPSLGHDVHSLDPAQAPNATAKQELEKLNLGLEMGNNVMVYLDDIQHTHPEFLQKFISLCDGSRRIEGVWRGNSKTYDLRGKKLCVVMAGNPYTESGETFKIPDMLANRADIYNLGDVLSGREKQFSLSYIENSLTSNAVLSPLATRGMEDVYKLIRMAEGEAIPNTDLEHSYSGAEINEITTVLKKLFTIQAVVLKVNQQYIYSAAQDDKYRTEPSFKLQGSYRNMNKMAEKVSGVMNDEELNNLIRDHYLGEAQTLTTGAEENLLKLGELNNNLNEQEQARWQQIKTNFARNQSMGGDNADSATRLANQVSNISSNLTAIQSVLETKLETKNETESLSQIGSELKNMSSLLQQAQLNVEVINQPVPGMDKVLHSMADAITTSLLPVVSAMEHKLKMDHDIWQKVKGLGEQISGLEKSITTSTQSNKTIIERSPTPPKSD